MFQSWHQPVHFLVISIIAKYWCCLFSAFLPFFSCSPLNFSFNYPLTSYHWTFGETKRSPQRSQSHRDAWGRLICCSAAAALHGCYMLARLGCLSLGAGCRHPPAGPHRGRHRFPRQAAPPPLAAPPPPKPPRSASIQPPLGQLPANTLALTLFDPLEGFLRDLEGHRPAVVCHSYFPPFPSAQGSCAHGRSKPCRPRPSPGARTDRGYRSCLWKEKAGFAGLLLPVSNFCHWDENQYFK